MPNQEQRGHSLCIYDRERAAISGVEDVDCFSEDMAVITTTQGDVTITGSGLKVARLDLQCGEVELEGHIDMLEYGAVRKRGFLSRLMR